MFILYRIKKEKKIPIVKSDKSKKQKDAESEKKETIKSSNDAYTIMLNVLSDLPHEEFWVVYLNRKNEVLKKENISKGGINGTVADVKIIFKHAIEQLASSIVLFHNHPSGGLTPSN